MRLFPALALMLAPAAAAADVPAVAADIAPVHSLVARVMEGVGEPALIVRGGTSPHDYAMRPSEAAAVQDADLVVWVGDALTPWLEGPLDTLGGGRTLELLEVEGTTLLPYREPAHAHEDHADDHEDHAADHDWHAHHGNDPHAWLDPGNGQVWLGAIAEALAALDPANAETYRANAAAGEAEIDAAAAEAEVLLEHRQDMPFVVYHDAYQYLEARFGLPRAMPVAPGDAAPPGPAHVERVARFVEDEGVACIFAEPQFNPGLVEAVAGDTGARAAILDPLATGDDPGPDLYPALVRGLAEIIGDC